MATVAVPTAGVSPTISVDWSQARTHPLVMMALRIKDRFALWHRIEPSTDAWASYAALGLAGVATLLAFVALPSF